MKKIVIWSTGGLASELYMHIQQDNSMNVVAFCASRQFCNEKTFLDLPLIPDDQLEIYYPPNEYDVIIAVGFKGMNKLRKEKFEDLKKRGYYIRNYIHKSAIIHSTFKIGEGNIILEGVTIGVNCCIGNGNVILMRSCLSHDIYVKDYNFFAINTVIGGFVDISNNCFCGLNSTIFPYIKVSEATLIGAGAVIKENTNMNDVFVSPNSIKLTRSSYELF